MQTRLDELYKTQKELINNQKQGGQVIEKIIVKEIHKEVPSGSIANTPRDIAKDDKEPKKEIIKELKEIKEVKEVKTEVQIVEKHETVVERQSVGLSAEEIENLTREMKEKQLKMEELSKIQMVKLEENIKIMKKELED